MQLSSEVKLAQDNECNFSQPPFDPNRSVNKGTMEKHSYVAFLLLFSSLSSHWWLLEMRWMREPFY